MRRFTILAVCFVLPTALLAVPAAPKDSCRIEDIRFQSQEKSETIHVLTDCDFSAPISYHFDYGITEIALPNTSFDSIPSIKINNRFLLGIDLKREGAKTILQILFPDNGIHSANIYDHEIKDGRITFSISRKGGKGAATPQSERTEEGRPDKSVSTDFPFGSQFLKDRDMVSSTVYMLIALTVVLALIYLLLWIYKKFFLSRFTFKGGDHAIRVVSTHHIAPKQKIVVLEINGVRYACGITPSSMNVIARIGGDLLEDYLKTTRLFSGKKVDFALLKQEYVNYRLAKKQPETPAGKRKTSFKAEFLKRIKSLQPID